MAYSFFADSDKALSKRCVMNSVDKAAFLPWLFSFPVRTVLSH